MMLPNELFSNTISAMDQIFVNNTSLSIVTCPKCHRAITVYMDTGADTEMVCPLCHQRYEFQAVIDGLPPMIKLAAEVDDSSELKLKEEPTKFSFDEVPAPPAPRKSTSEKRRSSSSSSGSSRSKSERRKRSEKKRKKAFRKSNPLRETILFVIGGLMALPVGQLIIWWAIGKDPLNLGPKISNVAGFAVPAKFHAKPTTKDDNSSDDESKNDGKEKQLPDSPLPTPNTDPDKVDVNGDGLLTPPLGKNSPKKKKTNGSSDKKNSGTKK